MLMKSDPDLITLSERVRGDLVELNAMHMQYTGTSIKIPKSLTPDMKRFDTLCLRHLRNDFRHTEDEAKSMKEVAQWVVNIVRRLRNQPPKKIEWVS